MSFFTRLRDPLLQTLKEGEQGNLNFGGGNKEAKPRDRAEAARQAWIVRKARFGPGGGNVGKGGVKEGKKRRDKVPESPEEARQNSTRAHAELSDVADHLGEILARESRKNVKLGDAIPWSKRISGDDKGKSPAGFIKDEKGKEFFSKVSEVGEAEVEEAVFHASRSLGWDDLTRPTKSFVARGDPGDRSAETAVSVQPLLPDGDQMRKHSTEQIKPNADKLQRMKIFEFAIGAVDRHGGNYWVDKKGDVHGIDYARSFYRSSDAEAGNQMRPGQQSDVWDGIWKRTATKGTTIARKHIQHIVDNEDKLVAAIPPNGGFRTSNGQAVSAMRERIGKLRELLAKNKQEDIDLKKAGIWR